MAQAGTGFYDWNDTAPSWMGYFIDHNHLMPAGGRIDPTAVSVDANGHAYIPSGFIVGRSQAEIDADAPFGKAEATDVQVYLVAYEVRDALYNADIELVRPHAGVIVKHNFLPDQTHFTALKAELDKRYQLVKGV